MQFNIWIDIFIEEKNFSKNTEFIVESNGNIHFISLGVLVDFIKQLPIEIKKSIKNKLVYLDFKNADPLDFFNHMAKGYIKSIGM